MLSPVWLYNPLPQALGHYEAELSDVLAAAGIDSRSAGATSAELGRASHSRKATAAAAGIASRLRASRQPGRVLVCWPAFGLLEPALWAAAGRGSRITVIVHDPTPLRRQFGMSRSAQRLGGLAARRPRIDVVVHSSPAADELTQLGWNDVIRLPHPVLRRPRATAVRSRTVLVVGQHKPARDLRLLTELGPMLRAAGHSPQIRGRGWPQVPGWDVQEGFLPEPVIDDVIRESGCVLIPYSRFYQSGIAVRAFELGIPVVGPQHAFLADLLGESWPGLVADSDPAAWLQAVVDVEKAADEPDSRLDAYRGRCEREWGDYLRAEPA